jgi:hypothetical protein
MKLNLVELTHMSCIYLLCAVETFCLDIIVNHECYIYYYIVLTYKMSCRYNQSDEMPLHGVH